MNLKKSFLAAIVLFVIAIASWEIYWRSTGKAPDIDDDKGLWAVQRAKVEDAQASDVLLLGSSRVLFDIQLDAWEEKTGTRPVMLACPGSSPLPVFRDIVENTDFKGTLIIGVTPGLFFSTTYPEASPWKRPQTKVDHYKDRTYAQRLNHFLSLPLQKNLAFISVSEEKWSDDVDLRSLLRRIKIGERAQSPMPPFYNFSSSDVDRNTRMLEKTVTDTSFANSIKRVWGFFGSQGQPPDKLSTTAFFNNYAEKFTARGGNIILLRCPSSGALRDGEAQRFPRARFWDSLVKSSGLKAYHFEDYDGLNGFDCPEWSHLSASDADKFTSRLVDILIQDNVLKTSKNK